MVHHHKLQIIFFLCVSCLCVTSKNYYDDGNSMGEYAADDDSYYGLRGHDNDYAPSDDILDDTQMTRRRLDDDFYGGPSDDFVDDGEMVGQFDDDFYSGGEQLHRPSNSYYDDRYETYDSQSYENYYPKGRVDDEFYGEDMLDAYYSAYGTVQSDDVLRKNDDDHGRRKKKISDELDSLGPPQGPSKHRRSRRGISGIFVYAIMACIFALVLLTVGIITYHFAGMRHQQNQGRMDVGSSPGRTRETQMINLKYNKVGQDDLENSDDIKDDEEEEGEEEIVPADPMTISKNEV